MSSKLFAFSRPLPAPFDKAKKKVKVSSKYGDGTEATLCSTVVKAVQAYFKCKDGSAPGAVGLCGTKGVAEYKSASGPEVYHLAIYDPAGGAMLASIYNKDTEMLETYAVRNNGQDGAAIMMSMLPALMADDEFRENLDALEVQYQGGYPDMGEATERMAILCDNAYRRINDSSCAAYLPTNRYTYSDAGVHHPYRLRQLPAGHRGCRDVYHPGQQHRAGETGDPSPPRLTAILWGSMCWIRRGYSRPSSRAWCRSWRPGMCCPKRWSPSASTPSSPPARALPMRNFLLRGPAGTGKTEGARAIAAGLNLPYMKYTCSAGDRDLRPDRPGVPRHGWAIHRRRRIGPAAGAAQGDGRHHL